MQRVPGEIEMKTCCNCKGPIEEGEQREHESEVLCEDCYIDRIWPKVHKMYYENDPAEFMRRLKESYSAHPQRYH